MKFFYAMPQWRRLLAWKIILLNPESILHLTILIDHDVCDRAPAARFIEDFKQGLMDPEF